MSIVTRRYIPLGLTFVIALIIISSRFFVNPALSGASTTVLSWISTIRAISVGLGFISVLLYHLPLVTARSHKPVRYQWFYSLTTLVVMFLFAGIGILIGTGSAQYKWLYNTWYRPVAGLQNAVSALFATTAIYRSFRVRNLEAAFLVAPSILIMLYIAPIGTYFLPQIGPLGDYVFRVIAAAAFRGFVAAAALGTMILSIRTIVGRERGYMPTES
jgi:hypothetical protein